MTTRIASILRQVGAVGAVVMGTLTASMSSIHLPAQVSTALVVAGAFLLNLEHYQASNNTPTVDNNPKPPGANV